MITDVLVLTNARFKSVEKHTRSVGGEVITPVLRIAGVAVPTLFERSVGLSTARVSATR